MVLIFMGSCVDSTKASPPVPPAVPPVLQPFVSARQRADELGVRLGRLTWEELSGSLHQFGGLGRSKKLRM